MTRDKLEREPEPSCTSVEMLARIISRLILDLADGMTCFVARQSMQTSGSLVRVDLTDLGFGLDYLELEGFVSPEWLAVMF